ncbi:4'-phosphopantetheinyl transferase superfamily protein [Rossellomorea aquimaris]|uniref:4'-phosphopantetheinyl transferase n=1 Tax=Rossellomorea aquimaris TaxID=189382 RepID=A0A366EKX6_9BACI|nr:4'-phosphopantetheinyl transferase superfamily protein [Rossellomorea aquimaris]RBP02129.1 4'-phosphopantetheinyl transferase [Rossellomorea aquimaris]
MNVYAINVSEFNLELPKYNNLIREVSKSLQQKIIQLRYQNDKTRSLVGELLLKYIILKNNSGKVNNYKIFRNKYGKPYLNIDNLHYNISHAGDWVVCCIDKKSVGVDIEQVIDIDIEIIKEQFHTKEIEFLNSNSNNLKEFYRIWTVKESFVKYTGLGLSLSFKSFYVEFAQKNVITIGYEDNLAFPTINNKIKIQSLILDSNYMLSICFEEGSEFEITEIIKMQDLLNFYEEYKLKGEKQWT